MMQTTDEAAEIGFFIPPMPLPGRHHVISQGQNPVFYRLQDLRDKGPGKTAWVDAFEKLLVGLYWTLDAPVPYVFRTPDGAIRSLDAGCIKMLLNRQPPGIELICDASGYIDHARPADSLLALYEPIKGRLIKQIKAARAPM